MLVHPLNQSLWRAALDSEGNKHWVDRRCRPAPTTTTDWAKCSHVKAHTPRHVKNLAKAQEMQGLH